MYKLLLGIISATIGGCTPLLVGLLFLVGSAPALAQLEPITISNTRIFKPQNPGEVKTIEDAMAAVMTVTTQDLGLAVVEPLYIYLHKDTNAFAANAGRSGMRLPSNVVGFAAAVAHETSFHINLEKTKGRSWGELLWLLAHEYAHNVEYIYSPLQLDAKWIREGFADWVAAKVLHHLGWRDYSTTLLGARFQVTRDRASLPALSEIEESTGWATWAAYPNGSVLTYRLAFLAFDRLMAKAGPQGMERYFRDRSFQGHFGLSWNDFYKEFTASLAEDEATVTAQVISRNPRLACTDPRIRSEQPMLCKRY
jgi:hypothetical protein